MFFFAMTGEQSDISFLCFQSVVFYISGDISDSRPVYRSTVLNLQYPLLDYPLMLSAIDGSKLILILSSGSVIYQNKHIIQFMVLASTTYLSVISSFSASV